MQWNRWTRWFGGLSALGALLAAHALVLGAEPRAATAKVVEMKEGKITIVVTGEDGQTTTQTVPVKDAKKAEKPEGVQFIISSGELQFVTEAQAPGDPKDHPREARPAGTKDARPGEAIQAETKEGIPLIIHFGGSDEKDGKSGLRLNLESAEKPNPSNLWIGVALEADKQGLEVEQVIPGSPAQKAGLVEGDVVLTINGEPAKTVEQLAEVVHKGEPIRLAVRHDGQERKLSVTPAKREAEARLSGSDDETRQLEERIKQLKSAIREAEQRAKPGQPIEFQIVGPGIVLRNSRAALPDDVSVTVTREGSKPAKITVKKGDRHWEASEGNLSELPSYSLPTVMSMLGNAAPGAVSPNGERPKNPAPGGAARPGMPGASIEHPRGNIAWVELGNAKLEDSSSNPRRPSPPSQPQGNPSNSLENLNHRLERLERMAASQHEQLERLTGLMQAQFDKPRHDAR